MNSINSYRTSKKIKIPLPFWGHDPGILAPKPWMIEDLQKLPRDEETNVLICNGNPLLNVSLVGLVEAINIKEDCSIIRLNDASGFIDIIYEGNEIIDSSKYIGHLLRVVGKIHISGGKLRIKSTNLVLLTDPNAEIYWLARCERQKKFLHN